MIIALIPKMDTMGAAVSAIVSYFILEASVAVWARRAISYRTDFRFLCKVIGAAVIMAFCLRFAPIISAWSVMVTIIAGTAIFTLGFWLLPAFSAQDRKVTK